MKMKCDLCDENEAEFSVEVVAKRDNSVVDSFDTCNDCAVSRFGFITGKPTTKMSEEK